MIFFIFFILHLLALQLEVNMLIEDEIELSNKYIPIKLIKEKMNELTSIDSKLITCEAYLIENFDFKSFPYIFHL